MPNSTTSSRPDVLPMHQPKSYLEFATFDLGGLILGIDIHQVQEINRLVEITPVPHAPTWVRGVINLRGEVVTVVDIATVLNLEPTEITPRTRNIIVNSKSESIGLLVDQIADVVKIAANEIESPPANMRGIESQHFKGIYKTNEQIILLLDIDAALMQ